MKFNWNQTGMPTALVSRLGQRNEFSEFKTVLSDAGNRVMRAVDAESMARELVDAGGREIVEVVRELTTALANAERELESANRRYERLTADLVRRGISIEGDDAPRHESEGPAMVTPEDLLSPTSAAPADAAAEWSEWDRRFQSLLG